ERDQLYAQGMRSARAEGGRAKRAARARQQKVRGESFIPWLLRLPGMALPGARHWGVARKGAGLRSVEGDGTEVIRPGRCQGEAAFTGLNDRTSMTQSPTHPASAGLEGRRRRRRPRRQDGSRQGEGGDGRGRRLPRPFAFARRVRIVGGGGSDRGA